MPTSSLVANAATFNTVSSFIHVPSGNVLDGDGSDVYMRAANHDGYQRWQMLATSTAGCVRVRHCRSGKMLAHADGKLCLRPEQNDNTQFWQMEQAGHGRPWLIRNKASSQVLDSNGEAAYMEQANGGRFQEWWRDAVPAVWMQGLADTLTLRDICVPGSHDAGMYELDRELTLSDQAWYLQTAEFITQFNIFTNTWNVITGKKPELTGAVAMVAKRLGLTQSLNLYWQMHAGSRVFDLRPGYRHDTQDFHILHGKAVGPRLRPVLKDIAHFLHQHPSELAIIELSHFENMGPAEEQKLLDLLTSCFANEQLLQLPANTALSTVPLEKLRGKAVLLLDDDNRFAQALKATTPRGVYRLKESLPIFDEYANARSYDDMRRNQAGKFRDFGQQPARLTPTKPTLFLLNWTLTPVDNDDVAAATGPSVQEYAGMVNPHLHEAVYQNVDNLFERHPLGYRVNVLNLDYVQTANPVPLCLEIIRRTNP